jgi:hypothetical protein
MKKFRKSQNSCIQDCNGRYILNGDVIEFRDRWEWYRGSRGLPSKDEVLSDIKKYPPYRHKVDLPQSYELLLSADIQKYWEVVYI